MPQSRPPVTGAREQRQPTYQLWRRVRRIGYVLLGLQLAGYLVWSVILYRRFALTADFSQYNQAWYLVAHGNLDPNGTVGGSPQFWQNDAEFFPYVLAPLYWIFRTGLMLQWAQDLSVARRGIDRLHLAV